jgi:hypothetical protein
MSYYTNSNTKAGMKESHKLTLMPNTADPIAPVAAWMNQVNIEALHVKYISLHAGALRNGYLPSCLIDNCDKISQSATVSLAGVEASPWSAPFYGELSPAGPISLNSYLFKRIDNAGSTEDEVDDESLHSESLSNASNSSNILTRSKRKAENQFASTVKDTAADPAALKTPAQTLAPTKQTKRAKLLADMRANRLKAGEELYASKAKEYTDSVHLAITFLRSCISSMACAILDSDKAFTDAEANDDLLGVYAHILKKALYVHVGEIEFVHNVRTALTSNPEYNLIKSGLTFENWCCLYSRTNQLILLAGIKADVTETFLVTTMVSHLPDVDPFSQIRLRMRSLMCDNRNIIAARSHLGRFIGLITDALHAFNSLHPGDTLNFGASLKPPVSKQGGTAGGGVSTPKPSEGDVLKERILALETLAKGNLNSNQKQQQPKCLPAEDCIGFQNGRCRFGDLCRRRHSTATTRDPRIGPDGLFLPQHTKAIEDALKRHKREQHDRRAPIAKPPNPFATATSSEATILSLHQQLANSELANAQLRQSLQQAGYHQSN